MKFDLEQAATGLFLGLLGCGVVVLYTRFNRRARLKGSLSHWATGWLFGFFGMTILGTAWVLLCFARPHFSSQICQVLGGILCALSLAIYVLSARRVGRWRSPSRYSLSLSTEGIHGWVRHPQALSLCVLPLGLGLLSCSVPFLLTVPVWIAFWALYTWLEERLELIPTFGEEYLRYRETTPRLIPLCWRKRPTSDKRLKTPHSQSS